MKAKIISVLILLSFETFALAHNDDTNDIAPPIGSHLETLMDQGILTHIFSFHNIPDIAKVSRACRYFRKIYSEDKTNRAHLTINLPEARKSKHFYNLNENDLIYEIPQFDEEISKRFAQSFAEIKLARTVNEKIDRPNNNPLLVNHEIDQIAAGFLFDRHLPQIGNNNFLQAPFPMVSNRNYLARVEDKISFTLNNINPMGAVANILGNALDILADDDDIFGDDDREPSESWTAEQEFNDYLTNLTTHKYDLYISRNQCGRLTESPNFRTQIKMAIAIEARKSEKYRNLVIKKSESYERDFPSINENFNIVGPILNETLSESEVNTRFTQLTKRVIDHILNINSEL